MKTSRDRIVRFLNISSSQNHETHFVVLSVYSPSVAILPLREEVKKDSLLSVMNLIAYQQIKTVRLLGEIEQGIQLLFGSR